MFYFCNIKKSEIVLQTLGIDFDQVKKHFCNLKHSNESKLFNNIKLKEEL